MTTDVHHLAAAYVLDALDADERVAFEAHFPACEVCRADVETGREVAAALAGATAAPPSPGLRSAVMAEVGRTRQLSPIVEHGVIDLATRRRRAALVALTAAAAVVVVVVGVVTLVRGPADNGVDDVIAAPDAVVTALEGDAGSVQVVWSAREDRVAVLGSELPDPGAGLVYALWFLVDDGVVPAGLFTPDEGGVVRVALDVDDVDTGGFGITVEPAGGSPQPTTPVLYAGEL